MIELMLRERGSVRFLASGDCMRPTFKHGQLLEARVGRPKKGDIVLFRVGARLKTHRLIALRGVSALTAPERGGVDAPVPQEDLLAVVTVVDTQFTARRFFGRLSRFARLKRVLGRLKRALP